MFKFEIQFDNEPNRVIDIDEESFDSAKLRIDDIVCVYNDSGRHCKWSFKSDEDAAALEPRGCLTVKELKEWLKKIPDHDPHGEPTEVWIDNGNGTSSECLSVRMLNFRKDQNVFWCDIIFGRE